jgi:hypothetical protein
VLSGARDSDEAGRGAAQAFARDTARLTLIVTNTGPIIAFAFLGRLDLNVFVGDFAKFFVL